MCGLRKSAIVTGRLPHPNAVARPIELEDWLNRRLYHPLSERLAKALVRTIVSPNAVSVLGAAMVLLAAFLYATWDNPLGAALALLVHMSWHVLDGADGDLARLTGRQSPLGEVVDGASDYLSHFLLYPVLAAVFAQQIGPMAWMLILSAGYMRIPQAIFYETQRRQYQAWVYGKTWLRTAPVEAPRGIIGRLTQAYMALSRLLATGGVALDPKLAAMTDVERAKAVAKIKQHLLPVIQRMSPLSSNYRTLVIGGAMILGAPILIVVFELVILTLVMMVHWPGQSPPSAARQRALVPPRA